MRLKLLTNLNTLLLVAVCVGLGATLWWSQIALERPYLLMERYLGLSRQFQGDVARNMPCSAARPMAMGCTGFRGSSWEARSAKAAASSGIASDKLLPMRA